MHEQNSTQREEYAIFFFISGEQRERRDGLYRGCWRRRVGELLRQATRRTKRLERGVENRRQILDVENYSGGGRAERVSDSKRAREEDEDERDG